MLRDAPCFAASCESGNLWSARSTLFTKSADDESLKSNSAVCVGKARVRNSMGNASCPAGTGVCVVKTHLLRTFSISSPLNVWRPVFWASSPSSSSDSSAACPSFMRSEEHTSELQSPCNLVCRLLLEKKKKNTVSRVLTDCNYEY